ALRQRRLSRVTTATATTLPSDVAPWGATRTTARSLGGPIPAAAAPAGATWLSLRQPCPAGPEAH
ncbi:MAG: hypothetical protein LBO20_10450, partial [Bifidobacteriaceae bacterium]|nr:hypothetical protein [Bifidobacteriaceae bacterium]